jgi:hypothetical protein
MRAPWVANFSAIAKPMPRVPPVIKTTFPAKLFMDSLRNTISLFFMNLYIQS